MKTNDSADNKYTIREAARLSGLPESTLRYYETIGLIEPIKRDTSTKRRVYSENDINGIVAVACLSAIGLSIEDMRQYLDNRKKGYEGASSQVDLLTARANNIRAELKLMKLRLRYVEGKVDYWKAVEMNDAGKAKVAGELVYSLADEIRGVRLG